jgi:hypothetical protein
VSDELNELLAYYGRALDEIYRLRTALGYEAYLLGGHLALATYPKSRRQSADASLGRMNLAAQGHCTYAYADIEQYWIRQSQKLLGIETLTRAEFEAECS